MITLTCSCPAGFHTLSYTPEEETLIMDTVNKAGQFKQVTIAGGKSWKVPVAYILVHGIEAAKMESYGFEEWPEGRVEEDHETGTPLP